MTEQANDIWIDGDVQIINQSDVSTERAMSALSDQNPEFAAMYRWSQQTRRGGIFDRDKWITPRNLYDQMRVAQRATEEDDVVSGVLETTESLAFNRMSVQCDDEDEENIWDQIIEDIDLDSRIREMWREMFTVSQCYVACWWGTKSYKVKGKSKEGVQRKKQYQNLRVPLGVTLLDPLKVVPVGNMLFGQERLAWQIHRQELTLYENVLSGIEQDEVIARLITERFIPTQGERITLANIGVDPDLLFILNPQNVWRVTATRPSYKPFSDIRMTSIFELLDLKNLLREMERAHLLGATNFIVLIRKGTDQMPAKNEELGALQSSVRALSRVPVIVGDHRLTIDIITPKLDVLLTPEKHNMIDARITARLYGMFMTGNFAAGAKGDDSSKLVRIVARGLESRRQLLRRSIEDQILETVFDRNDLLTQEPSLVFHPKSIAIDFDPGLAAFIMDLLDRHVIAYGTVLEQIDLDEADEARKRQREIENFDDIFHPLTPLVDPEQTQGFAEDTLKLTQKNALDTMQIEHENQLDVIAKTPKPVSASPGGAKTATTPVKKQPQNADPKSAGRSGGGNRKGGGAAPGTGQGQAKDPRRKAKAAA